MSTPEFMLRSPAKLNWTLEVLGRREDGFHELRSWFVAAAFYDELSCRPRGSACESDCEALQVCGPAAVNVPSGRTNLVLRAEQAWRAAGGEAPPLSWSLQKNIPAGAGLGGGSGNAAAALRLLEAVGDGSAIADLSQLALSLGSDLPFFLRQESAILLGGRGETPLATSVAPAGWVVMAIPDFPVSTERVFAALDSQPCQAGSSAVATSQQQSLPALPLENGLLAAAESAFPQLKDFHAELDAAADFQLSGSGGTFFAYFPDFEAAKQCAASTRPICKQVLVAPLQQGPILRQVQAIPLEGLGFTEGGESSEESSEESGC